MLAIVPASRAAVDAFIRIRHRHLKPPTGDIFRLACVDDAGTVRGVASIGRPVARMLDDGWTIEVSRVATDGVRNGCSLLYGAARRIGWAMGYRRIVTYTLADEGGASLRAAGWTEDGVGGGGQWGRAGRIRNPAERADIKLRWSCVNTGASGVDTVWPAGDVSPQVPLFALAGCNGAR